jgi:hypothetical protein
LQQLNHPQFDTTLTNEEKEMLVQQVLSHLCLHEDVPPTLLSKIKSHFVATDAVPAPPQLTVLDIDEITSSPLDGDTTAHIATLETSPDVASLKSDHLLQVHDHDLPVHVPQQENIHDDSIPEVDKDSKEDETAAYSLQDKPKEPKSPTKSTLADHPDTFSAIALT